MYKIIISLSITMILSHVVHSQENENEESNVSSLAGDEEFADIGSAEYPNGLVEEIKSRILKSLHKTEAPKRHVPLPLLQRLNFSDVLEENRTLIETNISTIGKTKTDFLPANVDNICDNENDIPCVKFHFDVPLQDSFRGAELWLYKKESITEFSITYTLNIHENETNETSTAYVYNQHFTKSWIRFDVSHMISAADRITLEFVVSAAFETEGNKNPFLLMHTFSELRSLSKRSSYCSNDTSTCCKEKYFVKFKDIKWNDWIVQPEGYEANYCTGTCTINLSSSHHARVFMALCENNPQKFKETGKTECLTCAPTAYRPISVIYLDECGIQVVNHLPGMSVTDCGCV